MRKSLTFAVALFALLGTTFSTVVAQSATPAAGGGAVTVIGSSGQPVGTITVDSISDPFTDFDASSAPQRGFHYVGVEVTFDATGALNGSGSFQAVDADGFAYTQSYVYRTDTETMPDFDGSSVTPGSTVSGAVFFQLLDGVALALVNYQPDYQQMVTIADLRDEPVAPGTAVDVIASDGTPAGSISVDDVENPFTGYDPSSPPQRGFAFIGATITVKNGGTNAISVDPSQFVLYDSEGFLSSSTSLYRPQEATAALPDLQYGTSVEPGQSVTGFVGFQVLAGSEPGVIVYMPSSDRHVRIAEFGEGAPAPSGQSTPSAEPTAAAPPSGSDTDVTAADLDCDAIVEWATATSANISAWSQALNSIGQTVTADLTTVDVSVVQQAQQDLEAVEENQAGLDVPAGTESLQDALTGAFEGAADSAADLVTAIQENDVNSAAIAYSNLGQSSAALGTPAVQTAYNDLNEACPDLSTVGF